MVWQKKSRRRSELPSDWPKIRRRILIRDRHQCQWVRADLNRICGQWANEVDHEKRGDDHSDSNLRALCRYHHQKKTSHEGADASYAARETRAEAARHEARMAHPAFSAPPDYDP